MRLDRADADTVEQHAQRADAIEFGEVFAGAVGLIRRRGVRVAHGVVLLTVPVGLMRPHNLGKDGVACPGQPASG